MKLTDERLANIHRVKNDLVSSSVICELLSHIDAITAERDEAVKKQADFQRVVKMQKAYIHNLKNQLEDADERLHQEGDNVVRLQAACKSLREESDEYFSELQLHKTLGVQDNHFRGELVKQRDKAESELQTAIEIIAHQAAVNMALAKRLAAVEKTAEAQDDGWVPFDGDKIQVGMQVINKNGKIETIRMNEREYNYALETDGNRHYTIDGKYYAVCDSEYDLTHMLKAKP